MRARCRVRRGVVEAAAVAGAAASLDEAIQEGGYAPDSTDSPQVIELDDFPVYGMAVHAILVD